MELLTEVKLKSMNKPELIAIILTLNGERQQLDAINKKLDIITSELTVAKKCNDLLVSKIEQLERRCSLSEQYFRRECLEIVGIPGVIDDDQLESKVLEIFSTVNVVVSTEKVEACHRIGKKGHDDY